MLKENIWIYSTIYFLFLSIVTPRNLLSHQRYHLELIIIFVSIWGSVQSKQLCYSHTGFCESLN